LLVKELDNFKVKVTVAANETFESWREKDHDDLVLATAIAAWLGERTGLPWMAPPVIEVRRPPLTPETRVADEKEQRFQEQQTRQQQYRPGEDPTPVFRIRPLEESVNQGWPISEEVGGTGRGHWRKLYRHPHDRLFWR
jgi:hypothetical protein